MQKYKILHTTHNNHKDYTWVSLCYYNSSGCSKITSVVLERWVKSFAPTKWFRVYVSNKNSAQHVAYSYWADGRYCVDILVPNNEINDVFFRGVPFMDRLRLKYDIARAVRDCGMRVGLSGYDNLRVLMDYNRRQRSK